MRIKNRLGEILAHKKLQQKFLVLEMNITAETASRWVRNQFQPSDKRVQELERLLSVPKEEIFYIDFTPFNG